MNHALLFWIHSSHLDVRFHWHNLHIVHGGSHHLRRTGFLEFERNRHTHIDSMSTFYSEASSPQQAHMVYGKLFVDTDTNKSMDVLNSLSSEANSPQEAHTASGRRPSSPAASCRSHTSCAPEKLVSRSLCLHNFAIWKTKPDHLRGKDPPSRPSSPASSRPCLPSWSLYSLCPCPCPYPYPFPYPYLCHPCHLKSSQC